MGDERDSHGKKEARSLLAILVMSTLGFGADVISEGWTWLLPSVIIINVHNLNVSILQKLKEDFKVTVGSLDSLGKCLLRL